MKYPILQYSGIKNKPWLLVKPFTINLSNGDRVYIPKGYWTDFASIPRPLKLFIDHLGLDSPAFLVHDYLYNFGGYKTSARQSGYATNMVSRKWADDEMRILMRVYGANPIRQFLFYWAVRIGGVFSFRTI